MNGKRPSGLFIAGTNTGVGKTFVAAALARTLVDRGCHVGVYKPVLSGCRRDPIASENPGTDDDEILWQAAGCPGKLSWVSPQRFRAPLAPHLAARAEGQTIDAELLRTGILPWQSASDLVIVEGAGGLFSPLSDRELNADLAGDFGFPLVLVTSNVLGTIHATLATLFAAWGYREGLSVAAVVLNELPQTAADMSRATNFEELRARCAPCPVYRVGAHESRISDLDSWNSLFTDWYTKRGPQA